MLLFDWLIPVLFPRKTRHRDRGRRAWSRPGALPRITGYAILLPPRIVLGNRT